MSSNAPGPTFDPNEPRQALGLLDALLSQDSMNFNRATHNAIGRAVQTLSKVIDERDELLTRPALVLVDSPHDTAEPETGSNAQSAS